MIVFSSLTVGNGLSLSKFSSIGLLEGLSKCSGKGVWRKVSVTFLLPVQLGAGVAFYAFKSCLLKLTLSNSKYRSWKCVAFLKGAVLVLGWWEKLEADPKAWPCSGWAPAPPAENTSSVIWPPLCCCKTSNCQLGRENSVWVVKKRKQALWKGRALISQSHTELTK